VRIPLRRRMRGGKQATALAMRLALDGLAQGEIWTTPTKEPWSPARKRLVCMKRRGGRR